MSIKIEKLADQPTINILYTPSAKGRQDALLAGVPGLATMLLTCAATDLPRVMAEKIQFTANKAVLPIPLSGQIRYCNDQKEIEITTFIDHVYVAVEPGYHTDPKALIEEGETLWAAAVTERRVEKERHEAEKQAELAQRNERRRLEAADWLGTLDDLYRHLPEVVRLRETIAQRGDVGVLYDNCGRSDDWSEANRAVHEAEARRVQAERAAQVWAENEKRHTWAEEYGSERLCLLLAGGYECEAVYRDERLALELPGWVRSLADLDGDHDTIGSPDVPRNPTLDAMRAHKAAGEGVELIYVPTYRHDPDADGADDDGDVRSGGFYVLRRTHLGHPVYRLANPEPSQTPEAVPQPSQEPKAT